MAKKSVKFKAAGSDGMAYWLAVDDHDIAMAGGVGQLALEESVEHVLVWWMVGNPGNTLSITGTEGQRTVVTVKESKIPAGSSKGAGYRKFKV
jgi:hypothetical protein